MVDHLKGSEAANSFHGGQQANHGSIANVLILFPNATQHGSPPRCRDHALPAWPGMSCGPCERGRGLRSVHALRGPSPLLLMWGNPCVARSWMRIRQACGRPDEANRTCSLCAGAVQMWTTLISSISRETFRSASSYSKSLSGGGRK